MARTYRGGLVTGMALGLMAALLAPALRPVASRWGRPLAKGAVKGSLDTYEAARERLAQLSEQLEDLVAEAQVERATERLAATQGEPTHTAPAGPANARENMAETHHAA